MVKFVVILTTLWQAIVAADKHSTNGACAHAMSHHFHMLWTQEEFTRMVVNFLVESSV